MNVLYHDITDHGSVPTDVAEVVHRLVRPLASSVASKLLSSTPSSDELSQLESLLRDTGDEDDKALAGVLQLVLQLSSSAADVVAANMWGPPKPTTPIWYLLFRTVVRTAFADAHASGPVPFVTPRGFDRVDGTASMLISYVADGEALSGAPESLVEDQDGAQVLSSAPQSSTPVSEAHEPSGDPDEHDDASEHEEDDEDNDVDDDNDADDDDESGEDDENEDDCDDVDNSDSDESSPFPDVVPRSLFYYCPARKRPFYPFTDSFVSTPSKVAEPPEYLSDDIPVDAHILIGRGHWSYVTFPVICVADKDNIFPLLASVAYQRKVWNIDLPVVGLELSKYGSSVKIYVAWLDGGDKSTAGMMLPAVHIIGTSRGEQPGTPSDKHAAGVFDFANASSASLLARFLISMGSHFRHIQDNVALVFDYDCRWRSDSIVHDDADWISRIRNWACNVDVSDNSSTEESFPPTPPQTGLDMAPKKKNAATSVHQQEAKVQPTPAKVKDTVPAQSAARSEASSKKASSVTSDALSGDSCSVFALRTLTTSLEDANTLSWMVTRAAFTTAYIPLPSGSYDAETINAKIEEHDALLKITWPEGWRTLSDFPNAGSTIPTVHLLILLRQYIRACKGNLVKGHTITDEASPLDGHVIADDAVPVKDSTDGDDDGPSDEARVAPKPVEGDMEPHVASILARKLNILLAIADGSFTKTYGPANVLEAESRHDWDALLYHFYTTADEVSSSNVILERTLHFPINDLLNAHRTQDKILTDISTIAKNWDQQCNAQYVLSRQIPSEEGSQSLWELLRAARNQAGGLSDALVSLVKSSRQVQSLASREPASGVCDALLFTHPSFTDKKLSAEDKKRLEAFQFAVITPQSPRSTAAQASAPLGSPAEGPQADDDGPDRELTLEEREKLSHYPFIYIRPQDQVTRLSPTSPDELRTRPPCILPSEILIPILIVEYKKPDQDQLKAVNQIRMYLISAVKFLAALGIFNYAVYGLVTNGRKGNVMMAWMVEHSEVTYVMERNARTYDLSSPWDAFQFAAFLVRLRARNATLDKLFEDRKADFDKKLREGKLKRWCIKRRQHTRASSNSDPTPGASTSSKPSASSGLMPTVAEEEAHDVDDIGHAFAKMSVQ